MQVSWIDPEEVASLAESLRPPTRTPEPVAESPVAEVPEPLLSDQTPSPTAVSEIGEDTLDLPALRLKLQAIREKAIRAGLLTPQPEVVEAPAPAPVPVPAPASSTEAVAEPTPAAEPELAPESATEFTPQPPPEPEPEPVAPAESFTAPVVQDMTPPVAVSEPEPLVSVAPSATVKDRLQAFAFWTGQTWGTGDLLVVDEYGDLLWGPPKRSGLVTSMMAWNAAIRASAQAANGFLQIQQQTLVTGETLTIIPCQTRLGLLVIAWVKSQMPSDQETSSLHEALTGLMNPMA